MQGADEGRSRKKVSWASVNAAYTSLEVRDEVAASSRAELKEVVMDHPSGPKPHRFICENRVPPLPGRIRTVHLVLCLFHLPWPWELWERPP